MRDRLDAKQAVIKLLVYKMCKDYCMVRGCCVEAFFERWVKKHIREPSKIFRIQLMRSFTWKLRENSNE